MAQGRIEKLAIANRGEVAVRIIRACQELGIETVLLHSEADTETLAYRLADHTVCIGPALVNESYLDIDRNIQGALSAEADAIHPGFGFLSENAEFAEACADHRLIFVGPSAKTIRLFGDKISAKELVKQAGGPVIPGYNGEDQSMERLLSEAEKIGYPVIVKAAGGGGGRGLKVIERPDQARDAIEAAQREGKNAFGSDRVFLEKYLGHAKHIEFQIFGDHGGEVFHLYDRECSVQRRHQKIIEETLSPGLSPELRRQMGEAAVKIAKEAGYLNAGTIEFLVQDNEFYFLEANTRLQVEHPVTEMVMAVDLVKAQIFTAQGRKMHWEQSDFVPRGHAIECRIYAEDPYKNGLPSTGKLGFCHWPIGPGRRFEIGFEAGDVVTPYYDSMIAKVVVWDETRPRALQKMRKALSDTVIFGVRTNIPYLKEILNHHDFVTGQMNTQFISEHFPNGLKESGLSSEESKIAEKLYDLPAGSDPGDEVVSNPWAHSWS